MKKIGNRKSPDLTKALKRFIVADEERERESYRQSLNSHYGGRFTGDEWGYDDDYWDEYGVQGSSAPWWAQYEMDHSTVNDNDNDVVFPPPSETDEDDDDEFFSDYTNHSNDKKEIYYYPDIDNRYDFLLFETLKEFNDYCDKTGILLTDDAASDLLYNYETHCCLSPSDREEGLLVLETDRSYGGLQWSVSDDDSLD